MLAIIPAAGKGTRMAAVTGGGPKELLKLGSRSVIQRVVDEAIEAEVDRIAVISSPNKPEIDEFARQSHLDILHQPLMRGLADAVCLAGTIDDVIVLLGDCVYQGGSPASRMVALIDKGVHGCIAVEQVPDHEVSRYGIVEINEFNGAIKKILEKPSLEETGSRWAVAARYAFSKPLMSFLCEACEAALRNQTEGEVSLTEILREAIAAGYDIKAVAVQKDQKRVDCGSPEEYAEARILNWD